MPSAFLVIFLLFVFSVSDENVTLALVEVEGFIVLTSLLITGDFNLDRTLKQTSQPKNSNGMASCYMYAVLRLLERK